MIKLTTTFPPEGALPWSDILAYPPVNTDGLLPAIARWHDTGKALMPACMERGAQTKTLATGRFCHRLRLLGCRWCTGETSGHIQPLKGLPLGGDGDGLLILPEQTGSAGHPDRSSCFHNAWTALGSNFSIVGDRA